MCMTSHVIFPFIASDSHTELGNEEQHGMIQQMMRVREQINLDLENKTGILQKQNVMLESELREIRKEKMDFEKNLEELELKCKQQCFHLEEKCKELENDVEMFKQKGKLYIKTILNNFILFTATVPKPSVSNIGIQVHDYSHSSTDEKIAPQVLMPRGNIS